MAAARPARFIPGRGGKLVHRHGRPDGGGRTRNTHYRPDRIADVADIDLLAAFHRRGGTGRTVADARQRDIPRTGECGNFVDGHLRSRPPGPPPEAAVTELVAGAHRRRIAE